MYLLVQKIPNIKDLGPSKLLNQVKSFLPQLEAAEMSLQARVDAGENVDIENIEEEKPHIEMNFGLNEIHNSDSGSSDSDPDSPPSPAERDNSYTSDSDVDTSSSSSSCSCKVKTFNKSCCNVGGSPKKIKWLSIGK